MADETESEGPKDPPGAAPPGADGQNAPNKTPEAEATPEPPSLRVQPSPDPDDWRLAGGQPSDQSPSPDYPSSEPEELRRLRSRLVSLIRDGGAQAQSFSAGLWKRIRSIRRPRTWRETAIWGGWGVGGLVGIFLLFFVFMTWGMPSTDDLWAARNAPSITFVDRSGTVILREGAQNAPPVALETLPPYVPQAFIAIEDRRFYQHFGVDFGGLSRALVENVRSGRVVQGGSTITQQLAKNLFLSNSRTFRRKFQEVVLAIWLEGRFSKDELLALYLSRVYFGAGAWGVEAASERYFDRPARELTLLQSALLAGLVKAPSRLNPAAQEASARARAEIVLDQMVQEGFISDSERQAALREDLRISRTNPAGNLGYFRDWIDPILNQVIGDTRDDFIVETTLDFQAQRAGERAVETVLAEQGEARRVSQAALVAIDSDGGVRSMIGGRGYGKAEGQSEFNRVTQARRQPGSAFKFFIYLAAMEAGLTPWTVRVDAPVTIGDWSPGNYNDEFFGPIQLVGAFARSLNMVAIVVANEIGGAHVIEVARRLGVRSPLHNYRSLALGAQEITLLEMTQAFAAIAADGRRVEAHGVSRVMRANGEVMWSWRPQSRDKVMDDQHRRYMNLMLNRVVEGGTGTAARLPGRMLGGKTGTANDYRDAWFIGFAPGLAAGVWVGNDDHRLAMARVTGGQLPAQIWRDYMQVALRNVPVRPLELPGPDDYALGPSAPEQSVAPVIVGAPIGGAMAPAAPPDPNVDRSLDFGPEG